MSKRRRHRDFRDLNAILILDKPIGCSSNRALQQVRQLYQARKAGHCGSLDPLASGLLPICFGEATKFASYMLGADKTYLAECKLGQVTTTGDAEGDLLEELPVVVDVAQIKTLFESLIGEIMQVPPMYSALKHEGKRLYQLAREGKQVERKPRAVTIHALTLLSCSGSSLRFEVTCSKGTYIRTLAEDIGEALGCGAHLTQLRRIAVANFCEQDAIQVDRLQRLALVESASIDDFLRPVSLALNSFPALELDMTESLQICQGKRVQINNSSVTGLHRLQACDGRFLGLGEVFPGGKLTAKRLMNTAR